MTPAALGREAYLSGRARNTNPYGRPGASRSTWFTAWDAAKIADNIAA